jgi:tRNA(fMet)-specific endonuclease VapC
MPAVLLDTNAISDLMMDHPKVRARLPACTDPILTSTIALGEIRYGLNRLPLGKKRTDLENRALRTLLGIPIEQVAQPISDEFGRLNASLEGQGINLGDNDLWIAATALSLSYTLITRDSIFIRIPGLQVEDWSQ